MDFVERNVSPVILQALRQFPAVVLTGPRRAGKTFLLKNLLPEASYVQLENPDTLLAVREDPNGFLDSLRLPVVIDEIQQAPELFPYVRSRIDASPAAKGQWILTGSQESLLMAGVTESMAGRAAILRLAPFSVTESPAATPWRGGYPEALEEGADPSIWFSSYVQTYLEKDVRSILAVRNLAVFSRFLKVLASRHGQMLNKTAMAAPLGVSVPTITEWINVLETSGVVALVPPYYRNFGKRLVKTPKLYFLDSGLLCHLLSIRSEEQLHASPFWGAVFEGFAVAEVMKAQWAAGREREIYWFRDEQGFELDIIFPASSGSMVLAECKSSATVEPAMSAPARKLSAAFAAEGIGTKCALVYNPGTGRYRAPTAGAGVSALSMAEFARMAAEEA